MMISGIYNGFTTLKISPFRTLLTVISAIGLSACQTASYGPSFDGNVNGLSLKTSLIAPNARPYAMQVVKAADGHPVRDGESAMRFEVRAGDCGADSVWNDCSNDRERSELSSTNLGGEQWVHWSIYLPEDYPIIYPVKTALAQFHQRGGDGKVAFMFQNHTGGYIADNQTGGTGQTIEQGRVLSDEEMRGKWNDILVHVNWSSNPSSGFFHVYVNGEDMPRYTWFGRTTFGGGTPYFKFGIYRSFMTRRSGPEPTQIVYYDNVMASNACATSAKRFNCASIEASMPKLMAIETDRKARLKRARATQGKALVGGSSEAKKEACKDPRFAAMLPEQCGK